MKAAAMRALLVLCLAAAGSTRAAGLAALGSHLVTPLRGGGALEASYVASESTPYRAAAARTFNSARYADQAAASYTPGPLNEPSSPMQSHHSPLPGRRGGVVPGRAAAQSQTQVLTPDGGEDSLPASARGLGSKNIRSGGAQDTARGTALSQSPLRAGVPNTATASKQALVRAEKSVLMALEEGATVGVAQFNELLEALANAARHERAMLPDAKVVLEQMRSHAVAPDVRSYQAVFEASLPAPRAPPPPAPAARAPAAGARGGGRPLTRRRAAGRFFARTFPADGRPSTSGRISCGGRPQRPAPWPRAPSPPY